MASDDTGGVAQRVGHGRDDPEAVRNALERNILPQLEQLANELKYWLADDEHPAVAALRTAYGRTRDELRRRQE